MSWAYSTYGGEEKHIKGFGGETWGNKPVEKPRHRWKGNIKMDLQEVGWGARTGLIWLRTGTGEYGNEYPGYIKCGELLD